MKNFILYKSYYIVEIVFIIRNSYIFYIFKIIIKSFTDIVCIHSICVAEKNRRQVSIFSLYRYQMFWYIFTVHSEINGYLPCWIKTIWPICTIYIANCTEKKDVIGNFVFKDQLDGRIENGTKTKFSNKLRYRATGKFFINWDF